MKTLVFGGSGMFGHKLAQVLGSRMETWVTVRAGGGRLASAGLLPRNRILERVVTCDSESLVRALETVRPDAVVNCIGLVKQTSRASLVSDNLEVNAVFPHRLAGLCQLAGVRLVHLSTDCVYSGMRGHYDEDDVADAVSLYGRSKLLGEVNGPRILNIRTSMIGRELTTCHGLIEWFLAQAGGTVRGFERAVFSGLPTITLAEIVADVLTRWPDLEGTWHVAADPIAKSELLALVRDAYGIDVTIVPDSSVVVDRSLNGRRFREATGIVVASWAELVAAMRSDPTPYSEIRTVHAN